MQLLTAGECTLEDLFESYLDISISLAGICDGSHWRFHAISRTQELQYTEIYTWMEPESALVRTKCRVELHTVSSIHLQVAFVIFPGDSELDNTLWNRCNFKRLLVLRILLE